MYANYAMCLVHAEKDVLRKRARRPTWKKKINLFFLFLTVADKRQVI